MGLVASRPRDVHPPEPRRRRRLGLSCLKRNEADREQRDRVDAVTGPEVKLEGAAHPQAHSRATPLAQPNMSDPEDLIASCLTSVYAVFPDICPEYLSRIADQHNHAANAVISFIADEAEDGRHFPKRPKPNLKRKREESSTPEEEDVGQKFDNAERHLQYKDPPYLKLSRTLLMQAFPRVQSKDVTVLLGENHDCLFPTYLALDRLLDPEEPVQGTAITLKKSSTKPIPQYRADALEETIQAAQDPQEKETLEELLAAIQVCQARKSARLAEQQRAQAEVENFEQAKAEGATTDCGCCFDEFALNRMVHCDGETFHYFCRECLRQMAEHQVGMSKYELTCMSTDSCGSGFARDQRALFIDDKTAIALERIEQEAVLRLAGIENLETCPFCPFAAEYPPVEENKEFSCENPECRLLSCRLCRKETHIPKTCAEAAEEDGLSARRVIEEAMSAALIRRCNKCNTPFIKENGCNKMTCTRGGCFNVQCYVCHKSCDYAHFDDSTRGGKKGNCPLFDSVDKRHEEEVETAEKAARKRVTEEHPDVDEAALEIKVPKRVKKAEGAPQPIQEQRAAARHMIAMLARHRQLHGDEGAARPGEEVRAANNIGRQKLLEALAAARARRLANPGVELDFERFLENRHPERWPNPLGAQPAGLPDPALAQAAAAAAAAAPVPPAYPMVPPFLAGDPYFAHWHHPIMPPEPVPAAPGAAAGGGGGPGGAHPPAAAPAYQNFWPHGFAMFQPAAMLAAAPPPPPPPQALAQVQGPAVIDLTGAAAVAAAAPNPAVAGIPLRQRHAQLVNEAAPVEMDQLGLIDWSDFGNA